MLILPFYFYDILKFSLPFPFHNHVSKCHLPFSLCFLLPRNTAPLTQPPQAPHTCKPCTKPHWEPAVSTCGRYWACAVGPSHPGSLSSYTLLPPSRDTQAYSHSSVGIWCLFFHPQEFEVLVFCFLVMRAVVLFVFPGDLNTLIFIFWRCITSFRFRPVCSLFLSNATQVTWLH